MPLLMPLCNEQLRTGKKQYWSDVVFVGGP